MEFPLADLVVAELGGGLAGAFCGRLFAGLGATVWKAEPMNGDPYRGADAKRPSALFEFLNGGKRSVRVSSDEDKGHTSSSALARISDVVVYSYDIGTRDAELVDALRHALRPGAALLVIDPFGNAGPYADYAATPIVYQALGGYMYIVGDAAREPLSFPGQQPYYAAGLAGFAASLAALRSGAGEVELSIHEIVPTLSLHTISLFTYEGKVRKRNGNRWATLHPITTYACADGWILLALPWEHWWERFCIMIGRPGLAEDERYSGGGQRLERADEVDAIVSDWLKDKTRDEVVATLDEWGLPKGPCLELDEVLSDEHVNARRYFEEASDGGKKILVPGLPYTRDEFPWRIGPVPIAGEHTNAAKAQLDGADARRSSHNGARRPANAAPLAGLRVIDLTWVWAGPLATRTLADLGAEVIKIEFPSTAARPVAPWNVGSFHELNRNKKSIALDLSSAEGADVFRRLVQVADVVVENFRPRVMSNWKLDYEHLKELNPELLMVSMPGFGSTGPSRDAPSVGPTIEVQAGVTALLGYDASEPFTSAFAYPDPVSAMWGVCGALAGLHWRDRVGHGCHVDISQQEATITMFGEQLIAFQRTGVKPERRGNRHPEWVPHGCYPCAGDDRWITVAVRSDEEWARLQGVIAQEWASDLRFETMAGRRRFEEELDRGISDWTGGWDSQALMVRLQDAGVAAGYVADGPALLADPQLEARGFFVRMNQPGVGERPFPGLPFSMAGIDPATWRPSPELGQHTQQVLEEVLGMSTSDAVALAERLKGNMSQPVRFVG